GAFPSSPPHKKHPPKKRPLNKKPYLCTTDYIPIIFHQLTPNKIHMRKTEFAKYVYIGIVTIIYATCLYMLGRNLTFETLTYDEAGQFFMSRGLNHYSEPNSVSGSLWDVVIQNQHYNRDPGGFSMILYFWSMISCNIVWLRLLPFLFFIGAIVFTCLTVYEVTRRKLMAFTSGLLLMALWGGTLPYCLRAYSMELCGMAFGLWMIFKLRQPQSIGKLAAYSIIFALFLTARYTIIIFGAVYALFGIYNIYSWKPALSKHNYLIYIGIFGLPLLLSVLYSYFLAMRIQNPDAASMDYAVYLYTKHWPFKLVMAGLIFAIATYRWQSYSMRLLTIICIVINAICITLGYFKLLPWTLLDIKGNCFVWLWYTTVFSLTVDLFRNKISNCPICNYAFLGMPIFFIIWGNSSTRFLIPYSLRDEGITEIFDNINTPVQHPIMVNTEMSPSVRYIFEHGSLKSDNRFNYPSDFIFLSGDRHSDWSNEEISRRKNYAILDNRPANTYLISYKYTNIITFPESYQPVGTHNIYHLVFLKQ
ncbi:hypothetical protein, partial [Muribaculum intestinale]|uniref:hypothetical protein n=1 Tax=Muribaculum intestinale TaxID=1796646 RepID=UPI002637091F